MTKTFQQRLDELDFFQIESLYTNLTDSIIDSVILTAINKKIESQYKEFINYYDKNYKFSATLGRGTLKYCKNIIYGWYIEEIIFEILKNNPNIKQISAIGEDNSHSFTYNHIEKKITIAGKKSTTADFEIILNSNQKFFLELKTSNKGIYTIKDTNVKSLIKSSANFNIPTLILMLDLNNKIYGLANLNDFLFQKPFINQRMEGQLCYNFPSISTTFICLSNENFLPQLNCNFQDIDIVKQYKSLFLAKNFKNKELYKIIEVKIKIDRINQILLYQQDDAKETINNLLKKLPNIPLKSWDEIYKELKIC
jgi:hypothetical protein